jgi:thiosulfate dehydrogenase
MKRPILGLTLAIASIYACAIVWGLHLSRNYWRSGSEDGEPRVIATDLVSRGQAIFNQTPIYASAYVGGSLSCESCHAAGGKQPFAAPMIGVRQRFPQFSKRAGRTISLEDRVRECFVRSENGKPPTDDSDTMRAVVAYIDWLSPNNKQTKKYVGAGFLKLGALEPDPVHGANIYQAQCAGCHGEHGEGRDNTWPTLWGPKSFNDGAGMYRITSMAAFVKHNMPQNRMGILSTQDAYDVSAFIHSQSRPAMNPSYEHY